MQTSFKKKQRPSAVIRGTQPSLHNGQLLCSTGVPSLDAVIGGGIPVGSTFLLEEDENSQYSNLLTRYFLAEGVMSGHELLIVSNEDESSFLNHLPEPVLMKEDQDSSSGDGNMKIAWRYQNNPQIQTSMGKVSKYGHYYDISKVMDGERLKNTKTALINLKSEYASTSGTDQDFNTFKYSLKQIYDYVKEHNFDIQTAVKLKVPMNILRIALPSFASPFWGCEVHKIVQFLTCLRNVVRSSLSVCLITIPTQIFPPSTVQLIRHSVDTVVKLDAFGSGKTNPLYKEYHGLLKIEKLPTLNSLLPFMPDTLDLAFKLRRKKFSVERLHLPPDISEGASRQGTEDENKAHVACPSSSAKSSLEF